MRAWLEHPDPLSVDMHALAGETMRRITNPKTDEEKASSDVRPVKWRGNPREDKGSVLRTVLDCLDGLKPILIEHVLPHEYQPELKFDTVIRVPYLDGQPAYVKLIGGLDIVTRHADGSFHNYDLKTTSNDQYVRSTLGQAIFYDIAFGHYIGDREQPESFAFLFPLLKKQFVPVKVTDDERRAMVQRIVRMAHGIWRGEWEPKKDDAGCNQCDVRHACEKFRLDIQAAPGKNLASFEAAATRRRTSTHE
jgi:hypothetical protein